MPVYEYWCDAHGAFEAMRPMSAFDAPHPCPECGLAARRAMLTAPRLGVADRASVRAHAVNERAADSPRRASTHGPGCACCGSGRKGGRTLHRPDGSKSFPSNRPWMISH